MRSPPLPRSDGPIMSLQREPAKLSLGRGGIRNPVSRCVALANQCLGLLDSKFLISDLHENVLASMCGAWIHFTANMRRQTVWAQTILFLLIGLVISRAVEITSSAPSSPEASSAAKASVTISKETDPTSLIPEWHHRHPISNDNACTSLDRHKCSVAGFYFHHKFKMKDKVHNITIYYVNKMRRFHKADPERVKGFMKQACAVAM